MRHGSIPGHREEGIGMEAVGCGATQRPLDKETITTSSRLETEANPFRQSERWKLENKTQTELQVAGRFCLLTDGRRNKFIPVSMEICRPE